MVLLSQIAPAGFEATIAIPFDSHLGPALGTMAEEG
jgi:hypothetical protein